MKSYIPILSIAGSDSSGGAGIQADIKTISAIGCYAMTAITALTAQNTTGVTSIHGTPPRMVEDQLKAIWSDIPPKAIKTGMLFDASIVDIVSTHLASVNAKNIVVDPVMISTSGTPLISDDAIDAIKHKLFPLASIVTPNQSESRAIAQSENLDDQIKALKELGCRNILIKGGDSDDPNIKTDYLILENDPYPIALKADAVDTANTHGTGCTLSSAIACHLALGYDMLTAVSRGKLFVTRALEAGARVRCGAGHGPVNHLFSPRKMKYDFHSNKKWK